MNNNPELWELASKIEGLITSVGVHPSGVIAVNEDFTKYNSLMKTSQNTVVSAFNLEDAEYMGGLKYDFLTVNGLDKIRTTMNLLLEDHQIEWEGSLRETYEKHLLPSNLEYKSKEMWKMAYEGKIVDLFQFDTPAGGQAIKSIKPEKLSELAIANSLMRLMKQENASESPSDTYVRNKNNLKNWYYELNEYGLSPEEIKILEKYLLPLSGIADSQEAVMMMVMDEKIADFDVPEANALRKAIAKKKKKILEETKNLFYEKGIEIGTSETLLNYVWDVQIGRQIGYSFSILHTVGYSTIALQEMNLAYKFPILYWNTACLTVNAGAVNEEDYINLLEEDIIEVSDEEDIRGASKVQYGKVASAIGKFRNELGLRVDLPDINIARFGFTPDLETNSVVFGMKGISRIGDDLIKTIIEKRPYKSLKDFVEKMLEYREGKNPLKLISKDRVINLIKAGAFDRIEKKSREKILEEYIYSICNLKTNINLNNFQKMIEYNIVPEEYEYQVRVYNFTKYLRKNKFKNYFIVDDIAQEFYFENGYSQAQIKTFNDKKLGKIKTIPQSFWEGIYQNEMDKIRSWIKNNKEELIKELNKDIIETQMEKYASGNILKWELEALNFYHTGHELTGVAEKMPIVISDVNDIPLEEVIGTWDIKGKTFPKYKIRHIIGTVLNKDKQKHLITLSTPEGIINVKIYRNQFAKYDKTISHFEKAEKIVDEESFFEKGTFLLVSGIRRGDVFLPKTYKSLKVEPIMRLELTEDYDFVNAWGKRE